VFGLPDDASATFSVKAIDPTGANAQTLAAGVSQNIVLFARNPAVSNQYVFAGDPTGSGLYGIYRSNGLTLAVATPLVSPTYIAVSSLSVTQDGANVVYSAVDGAGNSNLYVESLSGGAPANYGPSDGSTVSPADNDTIAYVAPSAANADIDQVFTRSLSAGPGGTENQVTLEPGNHLLPAFSRDGVRLAYWLQTEGNNQLVILNRNTGDAVALPNPANVYPQGEAFSPDGSKIVFAADPNGTGAGQILVQSTSGSAPPSVIQTANTLLGNYGIYWTDANGRLVAGGLGMSNAGRRLRKR
jgi:Tol biopolymer transport system component